MKPIPRGIEMLLHDLWEMSSHITIFALLSVLEAGGFDTSEQREGMEEMFSHLKREEWVYPLPMALGVLCSNKTAREAAHELADLVTLMDAGKSLSFSRGRIRRSLRAMFLDAGVDLEERRVR